MILTLYKTIYPARKGYKKGIYHPNMTDLPTDKFFEPVVNTFKATMQDYKIPYTQLSDNEFELYPETNKQMVGLRKFKKEALKIIHG